LQQGITVLRELIAKYRAIDPYLIAEIYAFRNQSDEAFAMLDRAYAKRDDGLMDSFLRERTEEGFQNRYGAKRNEELFERAQKQVQRQSAMLFIV
jgi:hypothetical protein